MRLIMRSESKQTFKAAMTVELQMLGTTQPVVLRLLTHQTNGNE